MEKTTVNKMISEIKQNQSQVSRSTKDENRVMRAMLSDTSYEVDTYKSNGESQKYCPAKDFQGMCASVISNVAKVPAKEATAMMENYTPSRGEASSMISLSKEFVNSYMQTGRKLSLGGRNYDGVPSEISLSGKTVEATTRLFPKVVGSNTDGSNRYEKTPTDIPTHGSLRVHASCPAWAKETAPKKGKKKKK